MYKTSETIRELYKDEMTQEIRERISNYEYCESIAEELARICAGEVTDEDGNECSVYDYICDALDIEYTCNARCEFVAAKVWVTLGGPNVWIDTRDGRVHLAWWGSEADAEIPKDAAAEFEAACEELYDMARGN